MNPDARTAATIIERLLVDYRADLDAVRRHRGELERLLSRWEEVVGQRPLLVVAAVELHAWYNALEACFERVCRTLDRLVPTGPDSHLELVKLASTPLSNVRPAIVPRALFDDLRELMKFRHFFRHAYRVELDPVRLERELRRFASVADQIEQALSGFDAFLSESLEELQRR
ncbi:MAG: hypothetical protein HYZ28_21550 [Myxococcales bacterium]|nr:hypothetical protein [Myxococcales bacterium]